MIKNIFIFDLISSKELVYKLWLLTNLTILALLCAEVYFLEAEVCLMPLTKNKRNIRILIYILQGQDF